MASFFHRQALQKRFPIVLQLSIVGFIYFVSTDNNVDGLSVIVSNSRILKTTTTKTEALRKRVIEKASQTTKSNFLSSSSSLTNYLTSRTELAMSDTQQSTTTTTKTMIPFTSWEELRETVGATPVGKALNKEVTLRSNGYGSAHVNNKLRLFPQSNKQEEEEQEQPEITFFRDHAGWYVYNN